MNKQDVKLGGNIEKHVNKDGDWHIQFQIICGRTIATMKIYGNDSHLQSTKIQYIEPLKPYTEIDPQEMLIASDLIVQQIPKMTKKALSLMEIL